MTYLEKAVEISTAPENCEGDNWGDLINLYSEADKEISKLKTIILYHQTMRDCCSEFIKEQSK